MEAIVGTTIISNGIRDMYNTMKQSFSHNNTSLNQALKQTDVTAKLRIAEVFIYEHEYDTSPTLQECIKLVHEQIIIVKSCLEEIDNIIQIFNKSYLRFGRKPNIEINLNDLNNESNILNSRIYLMLNVQHNYKP